MAHSFPWVALAASSLLTAAYLLPIVYDAWFREPAVPWEPPTGRAEVDLWLLLPTLVTAALSLAVGLFAGTSLSPLAWAERIAAREIPP